METNPAPTVRTAPATSVETGSAHCVEKHLAQSAATLPAKSVETIPGLSVETDPARSVKTFPSRNVRTLPAPSVQPNRAVYLLLYRSPNSGPGAFPSLNQPFVGRVTAIGACQSMCETDARCKRSPMPHNYAACRHRCDVPMKYITCETATEDHN